MPKLFGTKKQEPEVEKYYDEETGEYVIVEAPTKKSMLVSEYVIKKAVVVVKAVVVAEPTPGKKRGPKPRGEQPMSQSERNRLYRQKQREKKKSMLVK